LVVDFYDHEDILGKKENISNFYASCKIYSPTSTYRHSNLYDQCPTEDSVLIRNSTGDFVAPKHPTQNEKQDYVYDLNISTKKAGLYTVYIYAQ
jgi:hypothetical protein